jgi:hypothetical protein
VTVEGVVQGSENPSSFVPPNNPAEGNYYWLDVPGIVSGVLRYVHSAHACMCTSCLFMQRCLLHVVQGIATGAAFAHRYDVWADVV